MRHALRAIVLGMMLAGCRTPLLDVSQDASTAEDMAGVCSTQHTRVAVLLTSLTLADAKPFAGATVRMLAQFPWRPSCDVLGDVTVQRLQDSGPDFRVTAHVWRASDPTCTGTTTASAIVILDPALLTVSGPAKYTVGDGAGGTVELGIDLDGPAAGSDCGAIGLAGNCQRDCQCDAGAKGALCIPVSPLVGVCQISCDEDADCPDVLPGCAKAQSSPVYICANDQCSSDSDCPFGQHCQSVSGSKACRPPTQFSIDVASCTCDSDCGFGGVCAAGEGALACVVPCATTDDCPGHGPCANTCVDGQCLPTPCE